MCLTRPSSTLGCDFESPFKHRLELLCLFIASLQLFISCEVFINEATIASGVINAADRRNHFDFVDGTGIDTDDLVIIFSFS